MLQIGSTPAAVSIGSGAPAAGELIDGRPFTAYVTGTVPTDKETYQDGTLDIVDAEGRDVYSHTPRFRGRGNSTWQAPKKPFKVRSLNRQQRPFGFAASRDWALMADYFDQSHLRTLISFEIGRRATGRWTPRSQSVRLVWNDLPQGIYRYSETVDVQAGRVDIRTMGDGDTTGNALTGPYMLEVNNPLDDAGFYTAQNTPVLYDVPDVAGTVEQETYIQGWVNDLESKLTGGTEAEILALIDLPTWVDWYLLAESTKSMDTDWQRSVKWYKDQDAPNGTGRAVLWPPWDYDLSLGLSWGGGSGDGEIQEPGGWNTRGGATAGEGTYPNWLWHLWDRSPTFRAAVVEAWETRFLPVIESIEPFIVLAESRVAGWRVEDRALWHGGTPQPAMHTGAWISDWLQDRAAWMTANF